MTRQELLDALLVERYGTPLRARQQQPSRRAEPEAIRLIVDNTTPNPRAKRKWTIGNRVDHLLARDHEPAQIAADLNVSLAYVLKRQTAQNERAA